MAEEEQPTPGNEPTPENESTPEKKSAPEAAPDVSEILGQDDIDSLLQQVADTSDEEEPEEVDYPTTDEKVILSDGRRLGPREPALIEPCDFRNPAFLGETEMRRLRLMHEDFIQFLEARFALFLRMDFSLSMTKLTTIPYEQAVEEVENPSHLVLFRANPMPGMGFLEISPRLALTVASSILGGKGQAPRVERYLTKIEIDLIEEFLTILLQEWCSQWKSESTLEPTIAGHEVVANVLQICEHDTVMLSLAMEAQLRGCVGRIGIYVPLYMIEESVRKMQVQRKLDNQTSVSKTGPAWRAGFEFIPVKGKATFNVGNVTVRDIQENWKPGTVIRLPEESMQSVDLSLAGIPLFTCEVGAENEHLAVRILHKKRKRGPIWNMKK